jgi:hypothetical protein
MELDYGGLITLIVTISIVGIWSFIKRPKEKLTDYFVKAVKAEPLSAFANWAFTGIGIVGIWLTVRVIGLYVVRYLTNNYNYNQYEIFTIVAYALATNLCFTLAKTLGKTSEGDQKTPRVIEAGIQAVLVGIIVFLPLYGDANANSVFQRVGGLSGYVIILLTMAVVALLLIFGRAITLNEK